jgi:hypothetical protein
MLATGLANTVLCGKLFGVDSGVELFLAPCLMLAVLSFTRREWPIMLALSAVVYLAFLGLHDRYGAPLHLYTPEEYAHFLRLNAISVGSLMVVMCLAFAKAMRRIGAASPGL